MGHEADIQNLTHHQNITNAIITTIGESMLLHQVLLRVPTFDGRNMPLKLFLDDVESAVEDSPEALHPTLLRTIKAKLKGLARDAIHGKVIVTFPQLNDALKEYFPSKKSYPQYCADIQSIRLNQDETVLSYYNRIKTLVTNTISCLNEKFNNVQEVVNMKKLIDGLALESFKRGLPDDLVYAVSVQNPDNIEDAYKLAMRIEEDLKGSSVRKFNYLRYTQTNKPEQIPIGHSSPVNSFEDDKPSFFYKHNNDPPLLTNNKHDDIQSCDEPYKFQNNNYRKKHSFGKYYHPQYFPHIPHHILFNNYYPQEYAQPMPFDTIPQFFYPPGYHFLNPLATSYNHHPYDDLTNPDYNLTTPHFSYHKDSFEFQERNQPDEKFSRLAIIQKNYPIVTLHAPEFKNGSARFIVDTGTEVNLIKLCILKPKCTIATHEAVNLTGITFNKFTTLGSTNVSLFSDLEKFQVIRNGNLQLTVDGIIGLDFLSNQNVKISFKQNKLFVKSFFINFENSYEKSLESIKPTSDNSYNQTKTSKLSRKQPVSIANLSRVSSMNNPTQEKSNRSFYNSVNSKVNNKLNTNYNVNLLLASSQSKFKAKKVTSVKANDNLQTNQDHLEQPTLSTTDFDKHIRHQERPMKEKPIKIPDTGKIKSKADRVSTLNPDHNICFNNTFVESQVCPIVSTLQNFAVSDIHKSKFNQPITKTPSKNISHSYEGVTSSNNQIKNLPISSSNYQNRIESNFYFNEFLTFSTTSSYFRNLYYKDINKKITLPSASAVLEEENLRPVVKPLSATTKFSSGREVPDLTNILPSSLNEKSLNQPMGLQPKKNLTEDLHFSTGRDYQVLTLTLFRIFCLQRISNILQLYHLFSVLCKEEEVKANNIFFDLTQHNLVV